MLSRLKTYFPELYYFYVRYLRGYKLKELRPIPWICPDAIEWLEENITKDTKILEYGSGGSTLFFSQRAKSIFSVESDPVYFTRIKKLIKDYHNCRLEYEPDLKKYAESINKAGNFDIVFIDGENRNECIKNALYNIKNGYIILDNSDIEKWKPGIKILDNYEKIVFTGIPYGLDRKTQTTVYKIRPLDPPITQRYEFLFLKDFPE